MKDTTTKPTIMKFTLTLLLTALLLAPLAALQAQTTPPGTKKAVVHSELDRFAGWPANNGVWTWDDGREILVGFTTGPYVETDGHNIAPTNRKNLLARSTDGGMTWTTEEPANYPGNSDKPVPSPGGINFADPGFAMKVMGDGHHGHTDKVGSFFVSYDKGKNWQGPYRFNGLMDDSNLAGTDCTARTEYLVTGPQSCLVFLSARPKGKKKVNAPQFGDQWDKSYVAETTDGGKTFHFVSWIAPLSSGGRAVMPSVCRLQDGSIVATVRANRVEFVNYRHGGTTDEAYMAGHVDAYISADNGRTWSFLSRVGETGGPMQNGNPPALVALKDGRIACAYGDRRTARVMVRLSSDGGKTWGDELVARDNFHFSHNNTTDIGYPQLAQNHDNSLVVMYYWATTEIPVSHIAATILPAAQIAPPPPRLSHDFRTTTGHRWIISSGTASNKETKTSVAESPTGYSWGGYLGNAGAKDSLRVWSVGPTRIPDCKWYVAPGANVLWFHQDTTARETFRGSYAYTITSKSVNLSAGATLKLGITEIYDGSMGGGSNGSGLPGKAGQVRNTVLRLLVRDASSGTWYASGMFAPNSAESNLGLKENGTLTTGQNEVEYIRNLTGELWYQVTDSGTMNAFIDGDESPIVIAGAAASSPNLSNIDGMGLYVFNLYDSLEISRIELIPESKP